MSIVANPHSPPTMHSSTILLGVLLSFASAQSFAHMPGSTDKIASTMEPTFRRTSGDSDDHSTIDDNSTSAEQLNFATSSQNSSSNNTSNSTATTRPRERQPCAPGVWWFEANPTPFPRFPIANATSLRWRWSNIVCRRVWNNRAFPSEYELCEFCSIATSPAVLPLRSISDTPWSTKYCTMPIQYPVRLRCLAIVCSSVRPNLSLTWRSAPCKTNICIMCIIWSSVEVINPVSVANDFMSSPQWEQHMQNTYIFNL